MPLSRQDVNLLDQDVTKILVPRIAIEELSDVVVTGVIDGDTLVYDQASTNWVNAKATIKTTLADYGITDAYTKAEVDGLVNSTFRYKGTVANYTDLPTSGRKTGDVYNIVNADPGHNIKAGDNVCWNGSKWDVLSGVVDFSNYYTKAEVDSKIPVIPTLSTVAYTGKYSDIINRPTKLSDLIDDSDTTPIKVALKAETISTPAGSNINPIYIDTDGKVIASTATVGSDTRLMHIENGEFKYSTGAVGTDNRPIYLDNGQLRPITISANLVGNKLISIVNGSIIESALTVGDFSTPTFLYNGAINAVNLNSTCSNLIDNLTLSSTGITDTDNIVVERGTTSTRKPATALADYIKSILKPVSLDDMILLLNTKQDKLTAGDGITISNNIISSNGKVSSILKNGVEIHPDVNGVLDMGNIADPADTIKSLSASGTTITFTKGDGSTGYITTQDTTYSAGTGLSLTSTTFNNTGVLTTGLTVTDLNVTTAAGNSTIDVNTGGTTTQTKVYACYAP